VPKIMICGSRKRTSKMADYAKRCVQKALANGDSIIVGDACGIDEDVVTVCERIGVPYTCYGISADPRNHASNYVNTGLADYTARDERMVGEADKVMCIWNGDSNGTMNVFHYATKSKKQAWLATFIKWFDREEFRLKEADTDSKTVFEFENDNYRKAFIEQLKKHIINQM